MIKLTIDEREVDVQEDTTILDAAKKIGIEIPALCYHEALKPYGACRLCTVEVIRHKRSTLIAACTYPVQEPIVVKTNSEKVVAGRKMLLELLLAACPASEKIQKLARQMGIEKTRFKTRAKDNMCALCGMCVRVCSEILSVSAISFANRGSNLEVATPFHISSEICIGCGACAYICPTGAIKIEDIAENRKICNWDANLVMKKCKLCGRRFAPELQLNYIKHKLPAHNNILEICVNCRRITQGKIELKKE